MVLVKVGVFFWVGVPVSSGGAVAVGVGGWRKAILVFEYLKEEHKGE